MGSVKRSGPSRALGVENCHRVPGDPSGAVPPGEAARHSNSACSSAVSPRSSWLRPVRNGGSTGAVGSSRGRPVRGFSSDRLDEDFEVASVFQVVIPDERDGLVSERGRGGFGLVAKGGAEQDCTRPRPGPHTEIWRELNPVSNARLDPRALCDRSADQLEIIAILTNEDQDHASRRLDADEVDAGIRAQYAFCDQVQRRNDLTQSGAKPFGQLGSARRLSECQVSQARGPARPRAITARHRAVRVQRATADARVRSGGERRSPDRCEDRP